MRDFIHRLYPYQTVKLILRRIRRGPAPQRTVIPRSTPISPRPPSLLGLKTSSALEFDSVQSHRVLRDFFHALKQRVGRNVVTEVTDMSKPITAEEQQIMREHFGFWLERQTSLIPNAGNGVFIRGGTAPAGAIVAMYPGTLYRPGEAIFFNSLNNRYILKCNDGVYVDGKANGLSGSIYRSLDGRDNFPGITPTADTTWMTSSCKNPLACGQIVNNGTSTFPPNVRYQELDITTEALPLELQEFLPNIWYSGDWHGASQAEGYLRTVVLVTTQPVEQDHELYSTYIEQ